MKAHTYILIYNRQLIKDENDDFKLFTTTFLLLVIIFELYLNAAWYIKIDQH